jgi:uncharacterized protein
MVHAGALPGSPGHTRPVRELAARAVRDAAVLAAAGFDAVIVENMHDAPYVNAPHPPWTVAAMAVITRAVRDAVPDLMLGVQVLSLGHLEALGVAVACGAQFIRVENFAYAHVADEGLMPHAAAGELLRARAALGADGAGVGVRVICDVKKKHASHALTADLSLAEAVRGLDFFGADGVIVTGARTGAPTPVTAIQEARGATRLPVWVGSGVTADSAADLAAQCDGLIVGSWIKRGGTWRNEVDPARARRLVQAVK